MADAMKIAEERQDKIAKEIADHEAAIEKLRADAEHLKKFLEFGETLISGGEVPKVAKEIRDESDIAIPFPSATDDQPTARATTRMPSRTTRPITQTRQV